MHPHEREPCTTPGQELGSRPWWTPISGVLLCLPTEVPKEESPSHCVCCRRVSVPTRHGQHVLPVVLHISTPSHFLPCVLLPHHSCADPAQQLSRAMRQSRPARGWACPFTGDTAQLSGTETPPAQGGGRHKRPGAGPHKVLPPPQDCALRFRGCDDPTSTAQVPPVLQMSGWSDLSPRCSQGADDNVKLPGHRRRHTLSPTSDAAPTLGPA